MNILKYPFAIFVLCVLTLVCPSATLARTEQAGFSKDQIWFSKDPFFVGDNITISTLVFNSSNYRMQGAVTLKDGTSTLDKRTFIIEGGGNSQIITFPWVVTAGTHYFEAHIENGEFTQGAITLASSTAVAIDTTKVKRFADYDKNGNSLGDSTEPATTLPVFRNSTSSLQFPTNPVNVVKQQIEDTAPTPVSSVAIPVIGTLESIRQSQARKAEQSITQNERLISFHSGTTSIALNSEMNTHGWATMRDGFSSGQVMKSPLQYLKLLLVLISHAIVANPYLFYFLLLILLYKLLRIAIGMFA